MGDSKVRLKDLINELSKLQDKYESDIEVYITGQYHVGYGGWQSFSKECFEIDPWEGQYIDIDLGDV